MLSQQAVPAVPDTVLHPILVMVTDPVKIFWARAEGMQALRVSTIPGKRRWLRRSAKSAKDAH